MATLSFRDFGSENVAPPVKSFKGVAGGVLAGQALSKASGSKVFGEAAKPARRALGDLSNAVNKPAGKTAPAKAVLAEGKAKKAVKKSVQDVEFMPARDPVTEYDDPELSAGLDACFRQIMNPRRRRSACPSPSSPPPRIESDFCITPRASVDDDAPMPPVPSFDLGPELYFPDDF